VRALAGPQSLCPPVLHHRQGRWRIDKLFTAWPFLGSRRMTVMLRTERHAINRKRVRRLMRKMGIAALGSKPHTSKPVPGHQIFPYLLRGMAIERPNQVWCADITYIPIGRGFLYLVALKVGRWQKISRCLGATNEL
jgi:putative transposase